MCNKFKPNNYETLSTHLIVFNYSTISQHVLTSSFRGRLESVSRESVSEALDESDRRKNTHAQAAGKRGEKREVRRRK